MVAAAYGGHEELKSEKRKNNTNVLGLGRQIILILLGEEMCLILRDFGTYKQDCCLGINEIDIQKGDWG